MESQTPAVYLRFIRAISLLVPKQFRTDWRHEWEAEVICRWRRLEEWDRLDALNKVDLLLRVQGAFYDVICLQETRTRSVLITLNILVALLTGYGAVQEFVVRCFYYGQLQLLSLFGIIVSLLFVTSGIAMRRRWAVARRLIIVTGTLSILLHVYGALPPHRNMGFLVLIVGAGYGLVLLIAFEWTRKRDLVS